MTSENTLDLLEFTKLLRSIAVRAKSSASVDLIINIRPFKERNDIARRAGLINELMEMQDKDGSLGLINFFDISGFLDTVRPRGSLLDPTELTLFVPVLRNGISIIELAGSRDDMPLLREEASMIKGHPELLARLEASLDSEGNVLDSASALLADIRKKIRGLENRIRKKLDEIVRDKQTAVFMQDDFKTKRAGRWVIPVRMDSKGMVEGVVHDVSRSGETAFIEPLSIISHVNKLENMVAEEKAEQIRILKEISGMIRDMADELRDEFAAVVHIDAMSAVASYAAESRMSVPQINNDGILRIVLGRHPLLQGRVQPLEAALGGDERIMVITGPNAGGKTVAIKTIGMIALMAMSGMPVPADPSSSIPFITRILVDMGDEQSIEMNLSTFSAHIANIAEILRSADSGCMILIDELGTGTDPEEGSAIACAVLDRLMNSGALVFATTHLMGIKGFVQARSGMTNASMEFDLDKLRPLYKLRIGEPGRSHALEVARQYGLPDEVIGTAKELLGKGNVEFEKLIEDMNIKRRQYEEAIKDIEERREELSLKEARLEMIRSETERSKRTMLNEAREDASQIISRTKNEMLGLLKDFKKKDREGMKKTIDRVKEKQDMIRQAIQNEREEGQGIDPGSIEKGDEVFVGSLGYDARVMDVDIKKGRVKVRAGRIDAEIPFEDIYQKRGLSLSAGPAKDDIDTDRVVLSRIDLVGLRADDALSRVEPFLNHAVLGGLSEVLIVHGVGKGELFKVVRNHLEGHPLVKEYRRGEPTEGGDGVTIVALK
ncbi:MAG: endonuclease MutS2 [Nitrospirota bacterium]|nr:MAG: endonuclease MutS2 [Nitrospirota bacterium]